jgi:ketosteroid isomerase-like protein
MTNKKKLVYNNEDIVFEYFKLIKNKDIESLMDLFVPDAIVFEPFSKMTGGLQGRRSIESFLRVAIMANDTLQHQIIIEKEANINEAKSDHEGNSNHTGKDNTNVVTAMVKFEKGDSIKARFTFELTSDDSGNGHTVGQKYNRIKTLHIHFLE